MQFFNAQGVNYNTVLKIGVCMCCLENTRIVGDNTCFACYSYPAAETLRAFLNGDIPLTAERFWVLVSVLVPVYERLGLEEAFEAYAGSAVWEGCVRGGRELYAVDFGGDEVKWKAVAAILSIDLNVYLRHLHARRVWKII